MPFLWMRERQMIISSYYSEQLTEAGFVQILWCPGWPKLYGKASKMYEMLPHEITGDIPYSKLLRIKYGLHEAWAAVKERRRIAKNAGAARRRKDAATRLAMIGVSVSVT